jgi:hypothetical protein
MLVVPRQRTTAPNLAITIIVGILLFPVLEHFWINGSRQVTCQFRRLRKMEPPLGTNERCVIDAGNGKFRQTSER